MTVADLAAKITATEFRDWIAYFQLYDYGPPSVDQMYMAQIACTVARSQSAKPAQISLDQFELCFEERAAGPPRELTDAEKDELSANASAFWNTLVGE